MSLDILSAKTDTIPIIDIGPLRDGSNVRAVSQAIVQASRDIGFLYVANHGIDEALLDQVRNAGLSFFRQPPDSKLTVAINRKHRGFLKVGDAKMYEGARPDLKESLVWGCEAHPADLADGVDNPFRGDNQWPAQPENLRALALDFFAAANDVALSLLRGFAVGMALPEGIFLRGSDRPMSRGSFTYYPSQAPAMDQFGVAPHTDFGVLTVLRQDHVGGLQVQSLDGRWIAASPIPGTLVVNVGDLLERWSNGVLRSTPHRVINDSGQERLSLVFAYDPDYDTLIDPRLIDPNGVAKQPPITCGDYLMWRFGKSFKYRHHQEEVQ
jgi:isopenicillin N synthase-like dioxygenase